MYPRGNAFDIRCIRLSPYKLGDLLLLDVQHVIPLPEASVYTVRVREKENAVRQAKGTMNADFTKFVVQTPVKVTDPLPKRWAKLRIVEGLVGAGVGMEQTKGILPPSKTLRVDGVYESVDDLWSAIQGQLGKADDNRKCWHLADPIANGDETWVLNSNWGDKTRELLKQLLTVAPEGFAVYEEGNIPGSQA